MKIPASRSFGATAELVGSGGGGGGGFGGGGGAGVVMQTGDYIFLTGVGSSPEGDRPFIDRLNLKTLQSERLFRSDSKSYETVIAPLDDEAKTILTRFESPKDPPNYPSFTTWRPTPRAR